MTQHPTLSDRELLEAAAKAAGIGPVLCYESRRNLLRIGTRESYTLWRPFADDGESLRLACTLSMTLAIECESRTATAVWYGGKIATETCTSAKDAPAAARRAIVRCAALAASALEDARNREYLGMPPAISKAAGAAAY